MRGIAAQRQCWALKCGLALVFVYLLLSDRRNRGAKRCLGILVVRDKIRVARAGEQEKRDPGQIKPHPEPVRHCELVFHGGKGPPDHGFAADKMTGQKYGGDGQI